jgi:hypothetical protein
VVVSLPLFPAHRLVAVQSVTLTTPSCIELSCGGWNQTGFDGANLPLATELDSSELNHDHANWLVDLVDSAPYIASAFLWLYRLTADHGHLRNIDTSLFSGC